MQIKLEFITGKDTKGKNIIKTKTYINLNPKARLVRRSTEIIEKVDLQHFTPDTLDIVVAFICEIYNDQFTMDELYDGYPSKKLLTTYIESVNEITHGVENKLATFPDDK
jgi:hypothetical protein